MGASIESPAETEISNNLCSPFIHWLHLFIAESYQVGEAGFLHYKSMLTTPCKPSCFSCVFRTTWNGFLQICSWAVRSLSGFLQESFLPMAKTQHSSLLNSVLCFSNLTQFQLSALPLRIYAVWNHLQTQWECPQPPSPASDRDVKQTGPCRDPWSFTHLFVSKPDYHIQTWTQN